METGEIWKVGGVGDLSRGGRRVSWRLIEAAGILSRPKEPSIDARVAEIASVWARRISHEIGLTLTTQARLAGFARIATLARLNGAPLSRGVFGTLYRQITLGEVVPRSQKAVDVAIVIIAERFARATMLARDREWTPNKSVRELCADTQPLLAETASALARNLGCRLIAA